MVEEENSLISIVRENNTDNENFQRGKKDENGTASFNRTDKNIVNGSRQISCRIYNVRYINGAFKYKFPCGFQLCRR